MEAVLKEDGGCRTQFYCEDKRDDPADEPGASFDESWYKTKAPENKYNSEGNDINNIHWVLRKIIETHYRERYLKLLRLSLRKVALSSLRFLSLGFS